MIRTLGASATRGWLVWCAVAATATSQTDDDPVLGWIDQRPLHRSELTEQVLDEWGHQDVGLAALDHLVQRAIVELESAERGIRIGDDEVDEQIRVLRETLAQQSNGEMTFDDHLAAQNLDLARFRDVLRQAIACTRMIRQDFGIEDARPVPSEKQSLWYAEKRLRHEMLRTDLPDHVAARVGPRDISRASWAVTIWLSLAPDAQTAMFDEAASIRVLQREARRRGIEVEPEDVDAELAERDTLVRARLAKTGQSLVGVSYLSMLKAAGRDPQRVLQSDKFRAAILQTKLTHDRYGGDEYRAYYEAHRDEFDERYGPRTRLATIFLRAGESTTEEIPRTFAEALVTLETQRTRIETETGGDADGIADLFSSLARIYSEHGSGRNGGALGALSRSQLEQIDLPTTLQEEEAMTLHGPFKGSLGAHLVFIQGQVPPRSFDQLGQEVRAAARKSLVKELRDEANVRRAEETP